jgi:hypothetical protein
VKHSVDSVEEITNSIVNEVNGFSDFPTGDRFRDFVFSKIDPLEKRADQCEAECAAAWGALEEMRWPDLPGIPFWVKDFNEPANRREIPARAVVGIFDALRSHARELLPFGVRAVEALYREDSLKMKIDELTELNAKFRKALEGVAAGGDSIGGLIARDALRYEGGKI